jgi:hypothetical protein
MRFEERLLSELKRSMPETSPQVQAPRGGTTSRVRAAVIAGLAVSIAVGVAVILPTARGSRSSNAAWAVATNDDGTVTVEILDIRDAEGLERKLERVGVPAAVHYLPQNKLCAPPGYDARMNGDSSVMGRAEEAMDPGRAARGAVLLNESDDGAFVFTIDRSKLESDSTVVVFAEHDLPERGQSADTVASIAPAVVKGNYYETCRLVDGSIEGWGFQQGAKPGK